MSALTSRARTAAPGAAGPPGAPMPVPDAAVEVVPGGSRYGDPVWDLTSAVGRPTARTG
jgi:hypothetical protein